MSTYYIKLKDNIFLNVEEAEQIRKKELEDYKDRFPENLDFEVYGSFETMEKCLAELDTFGDIKELFEVFKK